MIRCGISCRRITVSGSSIEIQPVKHSRVDTRECNGSDLEHPVVFDGESNLLA